jgi:antitoxin MazE
LFTPKRLVDKDQAYFWSREWQEAEWEAEEDIRAGRVREFASVEELLRDLEE